MLKSNSIHNSFKMLKIGYCVVCSCRFGSLALFIWLLRWNYYFFHFIVRNWNRIMNSNNNYIPHLLARVAQKVHRNWPHNCNIFHERARKSDIQWWIFSHRFIVLRSKPILCEFFIRLTTPFPDALLSLYKFISATTFTWVSSNYSNLHATLTHTHTHTMSPWKLVKTSDNMDTN